MRGDSKVIHPTLPLQEISMKRLALVAAVLVVAACTAKEEAAKDTATPAMTPAPAAAADSAAKADSARKADSMRIADSTKAADSAKAAKKGSN